MNQQNLINGGLKERIMRRIYAIWFMRRALPLLGGAAFGLLVAYRATANSFFVAKIIENFLVVSAPNIWAAPRFFFAALINAEPRAVVVIAFSCIIAIILFFKLFSDIRTVLRDSVTLRFQRH